MFKFVTRKRLLAERNEARQVARDLNQELQMTEDLLTDAARIARRYENALIDAQSTIDAVNSPNGTTRKLGRIVTAALNDSPAAPAATLGSLVG